MAEGIGVWRTPNIEIEMDPNEKLFLFGYSCKVFRDDDKARYIEKGKHLIPWMGDETLMIDRYDVRGYLHDLKQYEPKHGDVCEDLQSEEEKFCDEERYRSLRTDLSDEQLYQEEELKRLRAAIASDSSYHEIGFSYDNEVEKYEPVGPKAEEPEDEPFEVPAGLKVPKDIEMPSNMKIHAIIEKTALFVSEQGGQMEIIIKMKQHTNPQFAFMHLDNDLHPYYKNLVKEIKSGSYKPVQAKRVSRSEDEDEEGHYLHPSLLAGKKENVPQFTVPSINFRRSQDDSYSVLVRNLQQQLAEEKASKEEEKLAKAKSNESKEADSNVAVDDQRLVDYSMNDTYGSDSQNNSFLTDVVVPPPDIQPIIHKMAEYVAKNGEDFEYVVKSKSDKRFEFLQPSCVYYNYYIQLRDEAKLRLEPPDVTQNAMEPLTSVEHCEITTEQNHVSEPSEMALIQTETSVLPSQNLEGPETDFPSQNLQEPGAVNESTIDEFDALYNQDSQDPVLVPEPQITIEDPVNSLDSVDSLGLPKDAKEKSSKVLKGPISFSLKVKEPESAPSEKIKIPLLLDDSDEDSSEETKEKNESNKREKSSEEKKSPTNSRHDSVEREEKSKLTSEMEAKLAEERKKDKLLSAARERLLQHKKERRLQMEQQKREEEREKERLLQVEHQRKEKHLQQERKKKAALFLKMLKKKDPESETIAVRLGKEKKSKSGKARKLSNSQNSTSKNGVLLSGHKINIRTDGLSGSSTASEESGEEIMITEFCSNPDPTPEIIPSPEKISEPVKREHKKKKKKRSRSRSREHHSKSSRSKDRHRSRSPRNHKHEKSRKGKELPAAYALNRSRSRSRSPRRHRTNPAYWNRRR